MKRDETGAGAPHIVLDIARLEELAIEEDTPAPASAVEDLTAKLAARARDEFRVFAAAGRIEEANQKAGGAQFRLTHLVAKHFVLSVQRAHRGESNWSHQLKVLEEILDTGLEKRLPRMPVDQLRSITGVPFAIQLPASGNETPFDAPRPLLQGRHRLRRAGSRRTAPTPNRCHHRAGPGTALIQSQGSTRKSRRMD